MTLQPSSTIYLTYTSSCAFLNDHNTTNNIPVTLAGEVPESIISKLLPLLPRKLEHPLIKRQVKERQINR